MLENFTKLFDGHKTNLISTGVGAVVGGLINYYLFSPMIAVVVVTIAWPLCFGIVTMLKQWKSK